MSRSLLRAAMGLALTSVILTMIMFNLRSPLAAVFELSVCAGLISVLFVSTISLTHPFTKQEVLQHMRERLSRFWYLPLIIVALIMWLVMLKIKFIPHPAIDEAVQDTRIVLWDMRQVDIIGQIIILLTGVFGVVIFFKERAKK